MLFIFPTLFSILFGMVLSFSLFKNDLKDVKIKKFIKSERFLGFFLQIVIAFLGFGVTLGISNANERRIEKNHVIEMLEQSIEFTENRLQNSYEYQISYEQNDISIIEYLDSNRIPFDYYNNLFGNDLIMENINMNAYGYILQYLNWAIDTEETAFNQKDKEDVAYYFEKRNEHLKTMDEIVQQSCKQLKGELSKEELNAFVSDLVSF